MQPGSGMYITGNAKSDPAPCARRSAAFCLSMLMSVLSAPVARGGGAADTQENVRLEIQLIVTAEGRALFESWDSPNGKPFEIVPVTIAPRGKFLSAVVLFKGCKADASGTCNVELDIVAYDPAGKVYGEMKGAELWQHRPAPAAGYTQLGVSYMGLEIEPQDPAGTYRVDAKARDRNAGVEAASAAQFDVQ
jgi:hypothetical protein